MRAALEALAAAHPAWLEQRVCVSDFARRYGTPMTSWRPPVSQARRDELAIAYARDGYALLHAVYDSSSPAWLRELPAVDVLRRVLLQNYTRTVTKGGREVIRRREKEPEGDGLPPGHLRIASPYDTDARWGVKREEFWLGYKLHITETCDDAPPCTCRPAAAARQDAERDASESRRGREQDRDHGKGCAYLVFPNLITHVATTDATVTDNQMTSAIHDDLTGKNLAPGRHYLDSGYLSAALVVSALVTRGVALIGPLLADTSAQARAGRGYARAGFAVDYDHKTVTCPRGKTSVSWTPCAQRGKDAIAATFSAGDCGPCPARSQWSCRRWPWRNTAPAGPWAAGRSSPTPPKAPSAPSPPQPRSLPSDSAPGSAGGGPTPQQLWSSPRSPQRKASKPGKRTDRHGAGRAARQSRRRPAAVTPGHTLRQPRRDRGDDPPGNPPPGPERDADSICRPPADSYTPYGYAGAPESSAGRTSRSCR